MDRSLNSYRTSDDELLRALRERANTVLDPDDPELESHAGATPDEPALNSGLNDRRARLPFSFFSIEHSSRMFARSGVSTEAGEDQSSDGVFLVLVGASRSPRLQRMYPSRRGGPDQRHGFGRAGPSRCGAGHRKSGYGLGLDPGALFARGPGKPYFVGDG